MTMDNIVPQNNAENISVSRSGRKRKATAKLAESNVISTKRGPPATRARLSKNLSQQRRIPITNENAENSVSKVNRPRKKKRTLPRRNPPDSTVSKAITTNATAQQPTANKSTEEHPLDSEMRCEVVENHTEDDKRFSIAVQSNSGRRKRSSSQNPATISFHGPRGSERTSEAVVDVLGGGVSPMHHQDEAITSFGAVTTNLTSFNSLRQCNQVPEKIKAGLLASKDQSIKQTRRTDSSKQGQRKGCRIVNISTENGNVGSVLLSGGSQNIQGIRKTPTSGRKEVARTATSLQASKRMTEGVNGLIDRPSPVDTMSAAIEAARNVQSGPVFPQFETRLAAKSSTVPQLNLSENPCDTAIIRQLRPGTDTVDRAGRNVNVAGSSARVNERTFASTRIPTLINNICTPGPRKKKSITAARGQGNVPPSDKQAISHLGSLDRNLVRFFNDQNEHNKSIWEKMDRMEAERAEEREIEQDRHNEVCRLLMDVGRRYDVATPGIAEKTARFPFSLLEGCCAMLRYVYSLAGKGAVSAKYMYSTTKTQEDLMQYVAAIIIEMERRGHPGRGETNDLLPRIKNNLEAVARDSEERLDNVSIPALQESSVDAVVKSLGSEVQAFLGSKIVTINRISVMETNTKEKKNVKHSVKLRLLDQRRRFHDHITTPVVNKWLQYCHELERFDTSLKTMKQDPKVFEVAGEIFEKDSQGSRRYLRPTTYGTAFYESCLTLKRMSADHTERALAQAMKAFHNSEKVRKICEKVVEYARRGDPDICALSKTTEMNDVFFTHQLAFVHRKVHARLEWLSRCKMSGGKSLSKPDRSHYALYLGYIMSMERQLKTPTHVHRNVSGEFLEITAFDVLGVYVTVPSKMDMQVFMEEFYGETEELEKENHVTNSEIHLPSTNTPSSQTINVSKSLHSCRVANESMGLDQKVDSVIRIAKVSLKDETDNESAVDTEANSFSGLESERYYEEED